MAGFKVKIEKKVTLLGEKPENIDKIVNRI